jgi:hypothetical protein
MATSKKNTGKAGGLLSSPKGATLRSGAGSDLARGRQGAALANKPVTKQGSITESQAYRAVLEYRDSYASHKK